MRTADCGLNGIATGGVEDRATGQGGAGVERGISGVVAEGLPVRVPQSAFRNLHSAVGCVLG